LSGREAWREASETATPEEHPSASEERP